MLPPCHRGPLDSQGEYNKVKGQIKVTPLHCRPRQANQFPYQVSTSYTLRFLGHSLDKIIKVITAMSTIKSRSHHDDTHPLTSTNVPNNYQLPAPYGFLRYSPDQILKLKVTTAKSRVKSRSHHDAAHLLPPTNVPQTTYQHLTPHGF